MNDLTWLFWLCAAALLAAAVWAVLRPLLRRKQAAASAQVDPSLAVYRARFTELDEDIAGGSLGAVDRETIRTELERDLLRAAERSDADASPPADPSNRIVATALAILLPALALGLYMMLGRPDLAHNITDADRETAQVATFENMVAGLAARMEQQPDDRQGWEMLARSYLVLGRYPEAAAAAERLYALAGDEPDVLVRLADALSRASGGGLAGRPAELVLKALEVNPEHRTALWLAGAAAAGSGDHGAAVAYWERLLPLVQNEPEIRAKVVEAIVKVRLAGIDAGTALQPAATVGAIRIRVELAPALAGQADPDATVFIVAKASEGPAMPLAVARRTVKDLPLEITLDDSMAMTGAAKLSDFTTVDLSARVSRSGQAERQAGDLIGELSRVAVNGETTATVVIDEAVP